MKIYFGVFFKTYNYGKHSINDSDIKAVIDSLHSGWLTQGPSVVRFEEDLCKKFGSKHAVAVSNGTAGLHIIGLALGWGAGDVIITTPMT